MTSEGKLYRYSIPTRKTDGVTEAMYSIGTGNGIKSIHYKPSEVVVVQEEPSPHFHKDSVNVSVEKISVEDI